MKPSHSTPHHTAVAPDEMSGFNRTLAEIEWLLLALVLVYLALPDEPLDHPLAISSVAALYTAFVLIFRYLNLLTLPTCWKFAIETWVMLAFTAFVVWHTGKVESPLISLFLLVIVFSALTLGKLTTLLKVALIASFYLLAAYTSLGDDLFVYATFSQLMLHFAPVVLVAYVTSLLASDISSSRSLVQRLSETDELTGVPNMRAFWRALAHHRKAMTQPDAQPFGILMVDADNLKEVNDRHGHAVGNRVIQAVAEGIRHSIRSTDLVARYGGDEFVLLLPNSTEQATREAGERIRSMVSNSLIENGTDTLTTTVSIGYATFPGRADTTEDLMAQADEALYASKRGGRNRILSFAEIAASAPAPAAASVSGHAAGAPPLGKPPDPTIPAPPGEITQPRP
ncbi:GGDEF domain-containing protein [Thiocapsa imhoffii]|uniref:diguanylate cyclase n=1 Tax=Thiocapsa imhoffii TaxID=382777 RepID=A0A9X0WFD5_9GAMM|nr:GGDEF domain-containing protein [Thiocapsa imhoffii]MBK1643284.1 GGDEF domain-containing protein [Thiocapsa imhoffii]